MKILTPFLALLASFAFTFAPNVVRAQDAPPPPPDDQGMAQDQGAPPPDQGDQSDDSGVSFQQFYDQLGSQGSWIQTDDYGYVFQPTVTDPDWAPYSEGHWVYSDAGWVWVSDEPWGWATYHYGRWINIDGTGWVWVPGYRWAPAWVSWRYGGGYCGWAPLPPETFIGAEFGGGAWGRFHFGGDVDVNFHIGAGCYNFVPVGALGYGSYHGYYLDRSRNYTVINNTTNITNITIYRNGTTAAGTGRNFRGVTVGGPRISDVNALSHDPVTTVRLAAANDPGRSSLRGNTLAVYAPRVNAATVHQARPVQVSQTIAHPVFNRGDSITRPFQVTRSVRAPAPTEAAIQAAQTAQLHAPARAKVATVNTRPRTTFTKPLTSLAPVAPTHRTTPAATTFNTVHPATSSAEHAAASAPFTGEPVHPAATETYHPENTQPVHPQTEQTFHPQTEQAVHPQTEQTFHPQTEQAVHPQAEQTFHPETQQTFHTQAEPVYHPQNEQAVHPQAEPSYHPANNPSPAAVHSQGPPPSHAAAAPSGGNKPGANQNNQGH